MFGKPTYDIYASARDHWLVALITNGEGYHNFHHRFPLDYRNGVRWYHWDPTKWFIAVMAAMNFTWDLKRTSRYRILEAKCSAENLRVHDTLKKEADPDTLSNVYKALKDRYDKLMLSLAEWENISIESRQKLEFSSKKLKWETLKKTSRARKRFRCMYGQWLKLINRKPLELQRVLLFGI